MEVCDNDLKSFEAAPLPIANDQGYAGLD